MASNNLSFLDVIGTDKTPQAGVYGSTIEKVLNEFGEKIVAQLVENLNTDKKNASGALQSSISFNITDTNGSFTFELSLLEYYKWVDKGRSAGKFPPPEAILSWLRYPSVINKIGLSYPAQSPYKSGKQKHKGGHPAVSISKESQLKSLAFLIGRKISRFGTPASNFYSDVINEQTLDALRVALRKALRRDVLIQISNNNENI